MRRLWLWLAVLSVCLCVAVGITTRPSFARSSVVPSAPATPGAATASHPVFAVGDMVTPTQSVILRGGPTNNSAVVTILIPGDSLTILFGPEQGDSDLWYEVMQTADGTAGWLPADLLRLASPTTGSATSPTATLPGSATPTTSTSETPTPAPWATAEAQVRKTANTQCSDKLRALTLAVAALAQAPLNPFSAGRLAHNPGAPFVSSISTGLQLQDFALYVEFQSPFSPAVHPWDFSLLFRDTAIGVNQYWLTIDSYGRWTVQFEHVVAGQRQIDDVMAGTVPNLRTSKGAWNGLFLIAHGGQGFIFLNGRSIAGVNLAENQIAGDISLAVGREGNTQRAGATTAYRNLGIWDLAAVEGVGGANGACLSLAPLATRVAVLPTATAPPAARTYTITGRLELRGTNGTAYQTLPDGRCEGFGQYYDALHEGTPVDVAGSPIRVVGQPVGTSTLQAGRVEASGCTFPFTVTVPKADFYVITVGFPVTVGGFTYSFDELVAAHWTVTLVT